MPEDERTPPTPMFQVGDLVRVRLGTPAMYQGQEFVVEAVNGPYYENTAIRGHYWVASSDTPGGVWERFLDPVGLTVGNANTENAEVLDAEVGRLPDEARDDGRPRVVIGGRTHYLANHGRFHILEGVNCPRSSPDTYAIYDRELHRLACWEEDVASMALSYRGLRKGECSTDDFFWCDLED